MSKLTILIPTFNRTNPLLKNLNLLENIFLKLKVIDDIPVLISDDGSKREHVETISAFLSRSKLKSKIYTHKTNLGIEENELFLVEKTKTQYAMLIGEDDYVNIELFTKILEYLDKSEMINLGSIICNFYGIDDRGKKIRSPMYKEEDDIIYSEMSINEIYRANQMTGLVFKVDNLVNSYRKNCPHTVYPQLYFIGHSAINGKIVYISKNPVANTVLKKKQFNYEIDNFTNEILSVLNSFEVNKSFRNDCMKEFLSKDLLRYCNEHTWLHPFKLLRKIDENYLFCDEIISHIKKEFLLSYLKIPFIVFKHYYVRIVK